jgi:hypothetical protein
MDDWDDALYSERLERFGDGGGDEIAMSGIAPDDETEGNDAVDLLAIYDGGDSYWDFEGARDANEIDAGLGYDVAEFLDAVLNERVREFLVVLGSNDTDTDLVADDTGLWLQRSGHAMAMEGSPGNVNRQGDKSGIRVWVGFGLYAAVMMDT